MKGPMLWLARAMIALACSGLLAWMMLAVYLSPLEPAWLRAAFAAALPAGAAVALVRAET